MSSCEDEGSLSITPLTKVNLDFFGVMNSTPLGKKSDSDTESLNSEQRSDRERQQSKLEILMMGEFQFVTYEGDWVASQYCPATETDVDDVLARLKTGSAPAYTEQGKFRLSSWPHSGDDLPEGARTYHKLFAQLLNQIIEVFAECFPEAYETSTFYNAKFLPYDKPMADTSARGEYPFKPKILLLQDSIAKGENASWQEVLLAVDTTRKQGNLGGPGLASGNLRKKGEFRLCFFHRSGLLATHAMRFTTTTDGFRDFVATIVGMLFWDRGVPQQAGYVPEQSPVRFSLNNADFYIHDVLCRPQAVCGRATSVYVVKRNLKPKRGHIVFPSSLINIDDPVRRMLNPLDPFYWKEDVPLVGTQMLDVTTLPDSFIIKCSHPLKDRISEVDVFFAAQGFIGVPRILTQYALMAFEISEDKSPLFWKLDPEDPEGHPYASTVTSSLNRKVFAFLRSCPLRNMDMRWSMR
ncbi:hypothetical protein HGRIS_010103 [Hohenbuehelia grisea]|uniref:Uncharacterized protein n=1 Tax=Hohenbuehelia grisea TaxID=104357 RepID=A0ABR3J3A2_9AGAR